MYDAIDRAPETTTKLNTIKDHADAIFEQFKGKGQEHARQDHPRPHSRSVRTGRAVDVTDAIKPVTDAMSAHLKKQIASAEEYENVTIQDFPELERDLNT